MVPKGSGLAQHEDNSDLIPDPFGTNRGVLFGILSILLSLNDHPIIKILFAVSPPVLILSSILLVYHCHYGVLLVNLFQLVMINSTVVSNYLSYFINKLEPFFNALL